MVLFTILLSAQDIDKLNLKEQAFCRPLSQLNEYVVSSKYGYRIHPVLGEIKKHIGVDFAVNKGTPVYATSVGVITRSSYHKGYGNHVMIAHANQLKTLYGHLLFFIVTKGDVVKTGQLIGFTGNTGVSTGPHLHYEVLIKNKRVDPLLFLKMMCKRTRKD